MKTIKINVPLTVHYESLPPSVDGEATQKRIESRWGAVSVSVSGSREAVDHMLSVCPTNDPPTLIQRALSALGYVVGDYEKDVAEFSRWVDHLAAFPQSEEALELWTNATLAGLPAGKTVYEASKDAQAIVIQRMRLFPPAPKTGLDDGPLLPEPWAELHEWRSAAKRCGIESAKELAGTVAETFGQFVDRKVTRDWQEATGCKTPEDASKLDELAKTWQDSSTRYEYVAKQRAREISEWVAKSGVVSPDALVEKFRVTEDAWKEATGVADTHAAYKKIADLESKILSYASEIDALRKLASPKRDWDAELGLAGAEHRMRVAAERELAKAKAELDSKRRECQTEKERADENARTTTARGILLDKIAEALGCDFNHDSLPEHVADLKRAHDNANDSLVGSDDLANETKEIASILASQLKDAGIESAAGAIAARSVFLSAVWAKSRLAREILLGGTGESIVDATKRVMDRCASLEQQIIADGNRTDELRKILHAKEGESVIEVAKRFAEQLSTSERASNLFETAIVGARKAAGIDQQKPGSGNYVSLTEWCQDAREKLSHAIIPLPKPEKVEAGQKWAFVMKAIEKGSSPPRVVGTFIDSNGSSWCAYQSDLDTGLYLGT
jgi:hypothetical protein